MATSVLEGPDLDVPDEVVGGHAAWGPCVEAASKPAAPWNMRLLAEEKARAEDAAADHIAAWEPGKPGQGGTLAPPLHSLEALELGLEAAAAAAGRDSPCQSRTGLEGRVLRGKLEAAGGRPECALEGMSGGLRGSDGVGASRAEMEAALPAGRRPQTAEEAVPVLKGGYTRQASVTSAMGGAVTLGASGGAVGFSTGGAIGAACGLLPAMFTLGLSIPVGAAIGSSVGLWVGAAAGGTAGFIGGGVMSLLASTLSRLAPESGLLLPASSRNVDLFLVNECYGTPTVEGERVSFMQDHEAHVID